MVKHTKQSTNRGGLLPALLTVGGFFLFLVIVVFFWFDRSPETVAYGVRSPEERSAVLREQREREQQALGSYGWVNREQGVVRLPIDRAMDLVIEEINQGGGQN